MNDDPSDEATRWTVSEWLDACSKRPPKQLVTLIPFATLRYDLYNWEEKLFLLIQALPNANDLETAGAILSSEQFLSLIKRAVTHQHPFLNGKLAPLLIGMSQAVFYSLMIHATEPQVAFLRQAASTEALQHHLTLLSHDLEKRFLTLCADLERFSTSLTLVLPEGLGIEDVRTLYRSADALYLRGLEVIHAVSQALALAWNTERSDLISALSRTKELCHKCLKEDIGSPLTDEHAAKGLWEAIGAKLNEVFSDVGADGTPVGLNENTPSIEALVKFSIWYLKDYYETGLLPGVGEEEIRTLQDDERGRLRKELLFKKAEETLAAAGLPTLYDLKREGIFSKKALLEYLYKKRLSEL